jgi:ABC-type nitrate/sulfonate/bicarbonate transport system substrate-binding protein
MPRCSKGALAKIAVIVGMSAGLLGSGHGPGAWAAPSGGALVSKSRCAANEAAGTLTYLTGFGWEASVGILDPIAAKAQGFYGDMCLRVKLVRGNGDPTSSGQLVAAGRATITELDSPYDAIDDAAGTPSIPVDAIATYGNTTIDTLLTMPSVTNLRQLDGKTIGYKGAMPPDITAMLKKAGVDLASLKEVNVGYDPTILPRGQVQALTAYKSNEPVELKDDGYEVRQWDPDSFGFAGAFNIFDVNRGWAAAHPGAVEDFLRATFEAFHYCLSHTLTCVEDAAKYQAGYEVHQNLQRWRVESGDVDSTLLSGHGVGYEEKGEWQPEYKLLLEYNLIKRRVDPNSIINAMYVDAIYHGSSLIWPGP